MNKWKTLPIPRFPKWAKEDPNTLAAWRYWTKDMAQIWWPEETAKLSLKVQWVSAQVLSDLHPDIVPLDDANEIHDVAISWSVNIERIRELEAKTWHDVIAINTALEEQLSDIAKTHVNKWKTSADTTQPVRALQLKYAMQIIILVTENFRDIMCEKAMEWRNVPFMDTTHWYDALPTTAWRPIVHYIEMIQSNLDKLKEVYLHSIIWKWWDATWNHHSATALWINWIELQQKLCERLWIWYMDASAQIPWLEFEFDVAFVMARLMETLNNIAKFIALWRSDDVNVFINASPQKNKGSSAMPHKDAKNWNPTTEEQTMSFRNYMLGNLVTAWMNSEMPYARNLAGSANARINFEDWFKALDHIIRNLAKTLYWLELREDRSIERVERSFWVVTSQQVMTFLTDSRETSNPMPRSEAHDLMWKLAQLAYDTKTPFVDVVLWCEAVTSRLSEETIRKITDPLEYVWQSTDIIDKVARKYYQKKTLDIKPTNFKEYLYTLKPLMNYSVKITLNGNWGELILNPWEWKDWSLQLLQNHLANFKKHQNSLQFDAQILLTEFYEYYEEWKTDPEKHSTISFLDRYNKEWWEIRKI